MTIGALLTRVARHYEFGRRIPASKLARRLELSLRRSLRDRLRFTPTFPADGLERVSAPPRPIFAPRRGLFESRDSARRFTFIGRAEDICGPNVDWATPGLEPRHQLWRMNLHYMEYLEEAGDDDWAALVADWIEANPPSRPGAWKDSWNSYAISLRIVVWMQELALRVNRLAPAFVARMEASLAEQLAFLENNLETDLGGNHLVKNIKALLWASAFFAGPAATRWRALGLDLLGAAIKEQILRDGVHYERSPSYHCQVFADLLECRCALGGDPLAGVLDAALAGMARAAACLSQPDGAVAQFNDAGLAMAYAPGECLDAYDRMFGARPSLDGAFALRDAGYFGLRTDRLYFVADCGRIAPDDLPAHGHGDVLSFELSVDGARVIVDQGVFEYVAGERREMSRAASSHNTLSLEGVDQADFFGAFRCGRRPNVEARDFSASDDGLTLVGAHDGFAHLPGAPRHVRRFEATRDGIEIFDRIEGRTDRAASIGFLLHPSANVEVSGQSARIARGGATLVMASSLPITVEDALWWPDMGREQATRRLRLRLADGGGEVVTTFRIVGPRKGGGES